MHILIVEGNAATRTAFREYFRQHGFEVAIASSEAEAFQHIENFGHFTVAIIDGSLNSNNILDTGPIIQRLIDKKAAEHLIAASDDDIICRQMMKLGCTHTVEGAKYIATRITLFLLRKNE